MVFDAAVVMVIGGSRNGPIMKYGMYMYSTRYAATHTSTCTLDSGAYV